MLPRPRSLANVDFIDSKARYSWHGAILADSGVGVYEVPANTCQNRALPNDGIEHIVTPVRNVTSEKS